MKAAARFQFNDIDVSLNTYRQDVNSKASFTFVPIPHNYQTCFVLLTLASKVRPPSVFFLYHGGISTYRMLVDKFLLMILAEVCCILNLVMNSHG